MDGREAHSPSHSNGTPAGVWMRERHMHSIIVYCGGCLSQMDGMVAGTYENEDEARRHKSSLDFGLFFVASHKGHAGPVSEIVEHREGLPDEEIIATAFPFYVWDFEKDINVARFKEGSEAHDYIEEAGEGGLYWLVIRDWPLDEDDDEAKKNGYRQGS